MTRTLFCLGDSNTYGYDPRSFFGDRYGERVKVYTIGDVSKEICGGPHAGNTAELKSFKIQKEESSSRGVRRIKAVIGKQQ